jgi:hypothetical protein
MPDWNRGEIERYLRGVLGEPVTVVKMTILGKDHEEEDVKECGYGLPLKVDVRSRSRERLTFVLHTISPGPFGHEHMADRAKQLIWEHDAFQRLPRHVHSLDVGAFRNGGQLVSLGEMKEFCLLTEYVEGETYSHDLERVRDSGVVTQFELSRADTLCDYLVDIHKSRGSNPGLYVRRIRELVGDGECIMGIADSYPANSVVSPAVLEQVEHLAVTWRWRIKGRTHRLRQVHGDFHPWNILFRSGTDFSLLDRSRGEYGDPADDVTSLTLNYLFFSLQRTGRLEGGFQELFERFWRRYLEKSGDREILEVAAPFLAFRGLVMANPVWYPSLSDSVRGKLMAFIVGVLESEAFDPARANEYCGA